MFEGVREFNQRFNHLIASILEKQKPSNKMILSTYLQAFEGEISYCLRDKDPIIVEQAQDLSGYVTIWDHNSPNNDKIYVLSNKFSKDAKRIFGKRMRTLVKNYNAIYVHISNIEEDTKGEQQHPLESVGNQVVNENYGINSSSILYTCKTDEEHPLFFITLKINGFLLHNCMLD